MGMQEKLLWVALAASIAAVFYFSGDGFYRYPCQDPVNWASHECQPPLCTAVRSCTSDLIGATNASE